MSCEIRLQMKKVNCFLPYPNECLPDYVLRKAENELRETPEVKQRSLKELKNLLQENPKLKNIKFEKDFLIRYLRTSKYSAQKTFTQLQNYVAFRAKYDLYQAIPDEYFSTKHSIRAIDILPKRCQDGCIIFYIQPGLWNPKEFLPEDLKKYFLMLYGQLLRDPMTQINGFKSIYDFKGTSIHQLLHLTPSNLYLLYHVPINCCPARIKELHFVNTNIVLTSAWKIMYPFLSDKLRKRCHFHSNTSELLNFFPASTVPAQYGGSLTDTDSIELARRLNKEHEDVPIEGQPNFY